MFDFTSKTKKREVTTDAILVIAKLLEMQVITEDVIKAANKKLEILINEL